MGGNEVIFKFLMISFKTPLESRFSWDPLHHFPYFSSPTLWIPPVFGIDGKVFLRTILAWQFHGARTIFHEQRRHLPEHGLQHILSIYLHFIRDHPHLDLSPSPFHYSSSMTVLHRL